MSYATSLPRVPTPPPPAQRPSVEPLIAESFEARASDEHLQTPVRLPASGRCETERTQPSPVEAAGFPASRPMGGTYDKGNFSDPPAFPGFQHYRLFKKALRRWDELTDVKPWRRAEKVLRLFSWELEQKMEHISESDLRSTRYLDLILEVLDLEAGGPEQTEKKRVVREALFEHSRSRDETMPQYVHRRMQQFQQAESLGIHVPSEVRGAMLEEGAMLGEQGLQNLRTLTRSCGGQESLVRLGHSQRQAVEEGSYLCRSIRCLSSIVASEVVRDGADEPDSADDFDEEVCQMLDHADLSEEQAVEVFAILERQQHRRKRTRI